MAWTAVFDCLCSDDFPQWISLDLCNIPAESPTRTILPQLAPKYSLKLNESIHEVCPVIQLPESFDAYLQSLEPRTSIYFHDCTFTDYPGQVHGSFTLLRELPESVRKKMILMHHEDDIENQRGAIESLGFRLGLPGQTYDLVTGRPT